MEKVEALLYEYYAETEAMQRLLLNLKKKGRSSFTVPLLESRLTEIKKVWERCRVLDVQINVSTKPADKKTLEYFTSEKHLEEEDGYWAAVDYITEAIAAQSTSGAPRKSNDGDATMAEDHQGMSPPLARIPLPEFTGDYTEWFSYRDLFESLVIKNDSLWDVQKLYYLKASVKGEASSLLKNVNTTTSGFKKAWEALTKRYNQSRHIIDSQLTKLFDIPNVTNESIKDLKRLRDHTEESVTALENLEKPVDKWGDLLTFMTVRKLDPISRREWEMKVGAYEDYPTFAEIKTFLDYRIRVLESIPTTKVNKQTLTGKSNESHIKSHLSTAIKCFDCNEDHKLHRCEKFKEKSVGQRQRLVRDNHLCFNCLSPGHKPQQCPSKYTCRLCKRKHHTLVHDSEFQNKRGNSESSTILLSPGKANQSGTRDNGAVTPKISESVKADTAMATTSTAHHASDIIKSSSSVMLATAWARLSTPSGREITVRLLLDQGSQSSFVTESVAQILKANRTKIRAPVSGIGGNEVGIGRSSISFTLKNRSGIGPAIACEAIVFQKLTSYVPQKTTNAMEWAHLSDLELADPDPSGIEPIHLLLGADLYASILREGLRRGPPGSLIAQKTTLGWIISGPTVAGEHAGITALTAHTTILESPLTKELRRFWELEEIPACSPLSEEESYCERHFSETHRRLPDGRYCVKLPLKGPTPIKIGASKQIALKWLFKIETKLARNPQMIDPYHAFMQEYIDLGHMAPTTFDPEDLNPSVFLPHHPVFKESSTTRLRVVFNASSKTSNGTSLNDHLMVGPKLQSELTAVILKWRAHRYAFTADITKMYRQILVDPDETRYQQILWRASPSQPVTPYRLNTVTYGTNSAPYLAIRVLKQLANDEESNFPVAARVTRNNFYVDDALFGANDQATANAIRIELEQMLARGGFTLRKWMASHSELLEDIPIEDREIAKCRSFDAVETIKVLGIGWMPENDTFAFTASLPEHSKNTKRSVLSLTAKLFDPLGWLTPVVITAKILIQELWIAAIDWDDELPPPLAEKWDLYCHDLPQIRTINLPRWTHIESISSKCQIHGFADASMRAYAAVVYLRVVDTDNKVHTSLLTAKSKVAPLKTVSIPRLELCAATLLAKLLEFVQATLTLNSCTTYAWTDSTVVLAWLKQHPSEWPTFVANRVASIQTRLPEVTWRHVSTDQNPADCASRGISATELSNHNLWWKGPQWLQLEEELWPRAVSKLPPSETLKEQAASQSHTVAIRSSYWTLCDDISSWPRLIRVTAYGMRFAARCRKNDKVTNSPLTAKEIREAKNYWIRTAQAEMFSNEISTLSAGLPVPQRSSLRALNPFIDDNKILRVGGRLQNSPLSFNEKHSIILPKHRVSTLIVENTHLRSLHGGPQLTTSVLRQDYWIVGHRPFIRKIIHNCVQCTRERAATPKQIMGNLPAARVTPARPFAHTGLDYAGPFQVRLAKGRGHKAHKAYLALFVCLSTRAVHLELVSDYSSETFLAAFRRFTSRRGLPLAVYSDNGTTFQGADKELSQSFREVIRDKNIMNLLATDNVEWHFIPPGAPHFGGLWEAGVKCTKHHLRRVIGARTLTFEELTTLIIQIEACLNSRPIGPMNADPGDFSVLTPGHFLIGAPLTSVPEPSVLEINENRLSRWQLIRLMLEQFWKSWAAEYIHTLQLRRKWTKDEPNIKIGDLVLIRNNNLPPSKWLIGRIVECHPGDDDRVRVVTIKTAHSELKRPISQICVLPITTAPTDSLSVSSTSSEPAFEDCNEFDNAIE